MIRVILAGEGRNELGGWCVEGAFRDENNRRNAPDPGVLETLLRQVQSKGWQIESALLWKKLPKLQVGIGKRGEEHNVRRAFHHAKKRGCDVLVFSRDRDGLKFEHRQHDIERAIADLAAEDGPAIVGAVAVEKLEGRVLAVAGVRGSEDLRRPEEQLAGGGVAEKDTAAMVALIERSGLSRIPDDAASLRLWLDRARTAFAGNAPP